MQLSKKEIEKQYKEYFSSKNKSRIETIANNLFQAVRDDKGY